MLRPGLGRREVVVVAEGASRRDMHVYTTW